jgi:hypothetical protein
VFGFLVGGEDLYSTAWLRNKSTGWSSTVSLPYVLASVCGKRGREVGRRRIRLPMRVNEEFELRSNLGLSRKDYKDYREDSIT